MDRKQNANRVRTSLGGNLPSQSTHGAIGVDRVRIEKKIPSPKGSGKGFRTEGFIGNGTNGRFELHRR